MDITAKKEMASRLSDTLKKNNEREPVHQREYANDVATLERVIQKRDGAEPISTGYTSYPEWVAQMEKEVGNSAKNLEKVENQKIMVEVLEYYVANA